MLLLTDRAIHRAGRRFWRRRFGVLVASYPIGTVAVGYAGGELRIDGEPFSVNPAGFQVGPRVGSGKDVELLMEAGSKG